MVNVVAAEASDVLFFERRASDSNLPGFLPTPRHASAQSADGICSEKFNALPSHLPYGAQNDTRAGAVLFIVSSGALREQGF